MNVNYTWKGFYSDSIELVRDNRRTQGVHHHYVTLLYKLVNLKCGWMNTPEHPSSNVIVMSDNKARLIVNGPVSHTKTKRLTDPILPSLPHAFWLFTALKKNHLKNAFFEKTKKH